MKLSECRKCELPVIWAKSIKGSNMMFDAEPLDPQVSTVEEMELAKWVLTEKEGEVYAKFGPRHEGPRWTSHFDTCEVAEGRGPKTRAAAAAKPPAVAVKPKGASVEVCVTFGDLIFSGTCHLVPKLSAEDRVEEPAPAPDYGGM